MRIVALLSIVFLTGVCLADFQPAPFGPLVPPVYGPPLPPPTLSVDVSGTTNGGIDLEITPGSEGYDDVLIQITFLPGGAPPIIATTVLVELPDEGGSVYVPFEINPREGNFEVYILPRENLGDTDQDGDDDFRYGPPIVFDLDITDSFEF